MDWQIPETNLKGGNNLIWLELPDGKQVEATSLPPAFPQFETAFEFQLPQEMKSGESCTIHVGSSQREGAKQGNRCQEIIQRRRPFHLHIDPKGKRDYRETELFALDVRGGALHHLRLIAPSLVHRNKRFDVLIRFEDIYGNLTANAPEGTLIELSYEHLRENLSWKLFVPETGVIALPNLYFNEPGVYNIQLRNLKTQEVFHSPPIKCLTDEALHLYWGQLHGESERTDSAENIEAYLRHVRDDLSLQFCATSSFDSEAETSADVWKGIVQQVAEFNEENRFGALLGMQWVGEVGDEGVRQFLYSKDNKPILRANDGKSNSLKKIYKTHTPKDLLSIISYPMGKSTLYRFEQAAPEFERLVEIYNAWGSSECTAKEGNLRPIQGGRSGISETREGSVRQALNQGFRLGFVAGGFDDRGPYETCYESDQTQYSAGLTAILAKEHTRSSLFEALQARSCYATTGAKIVVGFTIAGQGMGSELDTKSRPGLEFNRYMTGYALGTGPLSEIQIFRNGTLFKTLQPQKERIEFALDDAEPLSQIALESPTTEFPFVYYYLRILQEDGQIAWSSPIWVVLSVSRAASFGIPKKGKKKSSTGE